MDVQNLMGAAAQPPAGGSPAPKPDNKKLIIIAVCAIVGLSVVGAIGKFVVGKMVGFGMRKAIEAGTGVKIDENSGSLTVKGKDGTEVKFNGNDQSGTVTVKNENGEVSTIQAQGSGTAKKLPNDFPADFPLMSGLAIDSTWSMSQPGQGTSFQIVWKGSTKADDVVAFYRTELEKAGWSKTFEYSADNSTSISYQKKLSPDKDAADSATIMVETKDDGLQVGLTLMLTAR